MNTKCFILGRIKMMMKPTRFLFFQILGLCILFSGCGYKQSIMLQTEKERLPEGVEAFLADSVAFAENDIIKVDDKLEVKVYTNDGEYILDPNFELAKEFNSNAIRNRENPSYLVRTDSMVHLPKVGNVKLAGLTIYQADTLLANLYAQYYVSPFVMTKIINRRVIVLGAGEGGMVVPLENENMNLLEVLAVYGGIDVYSKAQNIRIIRGDLSDPEVRIIDLSTVEGMAMAQLAVQPNDIIYIEPWRKAFSETVRDITPVVGLLTSILTLIVLIVR